MSIIENPGELAHLREDLRRLEPPYLLRKYEATEEDYESLADEDLRCEFIDGVLIVHSPASFRHERRLMFLSTLLNNFVAARHLGTLLGSNAVMQLGIRRFCPDISFLAAGHHDRIVGERVVGPMDLAIELVSTSTRDYDLREKRDAYRAGRVPEIWLLDPERGRFYFDWLEEGAYQTQEVGEGRFISRVLPGFVLEVSWLMSESPPNPLNCLQGG